MASLVLVQARSLLNEPLLQKYATRLASNFHANRVVEPSTGMSLIEKIELFLMCHFFPTVA